mgnify:CR=1 FL=1
MVRKLKRRDFIKLSSVAVVGTVVAACAPAPAPTTAPEAPKAEEPKAEEPKAAEPTKPPAEEPTKAPEAPAEAPAAYKEAPQLAEKVAAGELPPVEERLPENPMVIANRERSACTAVRFAPIPSTR